MRSAKFVGIDVVRKWISVVFCFFVNFSIINYEVAFILFGYILKFVKILKIFHIYIFGIGCIVASFTAHFFVFLQFKEPLYT